MILKIKYLIVKIWKVFMQITYFFFKLLKVQNKITFMSRQTNDKNLDFNLIIDEIRRRDKHIKLVVLNRRLNPGIKSKVTYFFYMFKQMYHMATSKVIILDSYAILVSILKQRKETKVIQIWHALGSLKKFGYSILGKKEGRNAVTAQIMDMHKNNDIILTSSEISKQYFMEAFNVTEDKMVVLGLPRIDFLQSEEAKEEVNERFFRLYPEANNNKENILYVPTDRKNKRVNVNNVIKGVNYKRYNLIVKTHSGKEIVVIDGKKIVKGIYFLGLELLHVADYIITDYSAIVYEASLVNKPIYFYAYDYKDYMKNRGVYIDYKKEMPGFISKDIKKILTAIDKKEWKPDKVKRFANKYIEKRFENVTSSIVDLIQEQMGQKINSDRLIKEKQIAYK